MKKKKSRNEEIAELGQAFNHASNVLLIGFQGIKVADDEKLRRELRQANLSYRVVKNTLAVKAAKGTSVEQLQNDFTGPTAIAISKDDPITLAKIIAKWAKENPAVALKAGIVEGRLICSKDVETLATMPSKEELISKIMFLINSGAQRLAVVTAGVARNLAVVMEQVRVQKEAQG